MTIPLERFGAALCRHVKVRGTWARCIPIVCCLLLLLPPFRSLFRNREWTNKPCEGMKGGGREERRKSEEEKD